MENDKIKYTIVSAYAPTSSHLQDQIKFLTTFINLEVKYPNSLKAGDYNCPLSENDCKNFDTRNSYCKKLITYLQNNDIIDIYRVLNPDSKVFTWNNKKSKSRIDFWLCDDIFLPNISNARIQHSVKTDHRLITIDIISD